MKSQKKINILRMKEIKWFEATTGEIFNDSPEGKQMISTTLCIILLKEYAEQRIKDLKWWKKIILLNAFLAFLSCTCLPQIPDQSLYIDTACRVTVPDYKGMFDVYDNCTNSTVMQYPPAGTVFDDPINFSVDIVARDAYGNSTAVTFNVEVIDTIGPQIRYIGAISSTDPCAGCFEHLYTAISTYRNSLDGIKEPLDSLTWPVIKVHYQNK